MPPQTSIPTYGSDRADVRHLERTESGPRVKVSHDDREWICVVDAKSGEVNIEIGGGTARRRISRHQTG